MTDFEKEAFRSLYNHTCCRKEAEQTESMHGVCKLTDSTHILGYSFPNNTDIRLGVNYANCLLIRQLIVKKLSFLSPKKTFAWSGHFSLPIQLTRRCLNG
jgi:hypothetical protein